MHDHLHVFAYCCLYVWYRWLFDCWLASCTIVSSLNAVAPFIALSQKHSHYASILCVYVVSNVTGRLFSGTSFKMLVQTGLRVISSLSFWMSHCQHTHHQHNQNDAEVQIHRKLEYQVNIFMNLMNRLKMSEFCFSKVNLKFSISWKPLLKIQCLIICIIASSSAITKCFFFFFIIL